MAPRAPKKKGEPKNPTTGLLARTDTGKVIRVAGPIRPEVYGGKVVNPETGWVRGTVKTRPRPTGRPKQQQRPAPMPQRAGVGGGDKQRLSFLPGKGPRNELLPRATWEPPPGPWRQSIELSRRRRDVEASIRRANYSSPLAFVGRTISKSAQTGMDIITGLPAAAVRGVQLTATAARAVGKDPTAGPGDQIEAAKTLAREGRATVGYYGGLGRDFATRPIWAIENRLVEGALAAGLVWSGGGQALGYAARQGRSAAQLARGVEQTGSIRGGVRVARAQRRADVLAQDRARRSRGDQSRPAGAPTPGGLPAASFVFRSADQTLDSARRAAEVTGNVVGGRLPQMLDRVADWGSKSTLEGSPRARAPRIVSAPGRDRRGREIGPVDAQGNFTGPRPDYAIPRRPRSSNPLSRSVQRRVTEPIGAQVRGAVDRATERIPFAPDAMSRAVRAETRGMAYAIPETVDRTILVEAGDFSKMVGRLSAAGRRNGLPESEAARGATAAAIRAMGVAEDLGGSRVWGRDELITRTRNTLNDPNSGIGRRQRKALEDNLRTLEAIPDEWLDPATAPKWLNDLDGEARRLLRTATEIKRGMGLISGDSAQWAGRRAQAQLMGARPLRRVVGEVTRGGYTGGYVRDIRLARAIGEELEYRASRGTRGKTRERFSGYTTDALRTQQKALQRRARTMKGRVAGYLRAADEDALRPYVGVRDARAAVNRAEQRLATERASGTARGVEAATRELVRARRRLTNQRTRARRTAYVGGDLPARAGIPAGEYFPQRSTFRERAGLSVEPTGGRNTRWAPKKEAFNAAVLADRGDISFSPRQVINALREAVDARERVRVASAVITRFAVKDGDRLLEGPAARRFVDQMGGDGRTYSLISERQLARISSLSSDSEAGQRLMKALDESINPKAERVYVVPTAVIRGWNDALGPAGTRAGRAIDQLNSLWKGGVLALNPRWYVQNFVGMWGQFILGAGADLQAINMAASRAYLDAIPGRISAMGLSQDFGELARRMEGQQTNLAGSIIRAGFNMNERLEAVPRRAMFWHAAKRGLRENEFIKRGVMDEGYLARAWLDVVEGAKRGDPGAERILDDVIVETERFMGNYSRYNAFEKNFLRRIFPFYGWMRSINRLAFALPVKHPKRAAILSMASLMAYEMYGLERTDLTGYRTGLFAGDRLIGMNTLIGLQTTMPTFRAIQEAGRAIEEINPNDPLSYIGAVDNITVDAFRSAAEQAGPLLGIPYTKVAGQTIGGVPLRFSPGYQGYNLTPTGRYERTNPVTGRIEPGTPSTGWLSAIEQSFPLVNQARNLAAGENRPYADARLDQLIRGARDPRRAPFLVQNDPKSPRATKTDILSFIGNLAVGVPMDRVDPVAIQINEAEAWKRMWQRLTAAEKRILIGEAQARARNRRP